ncbi:response regulator [Phormidesmis priestleyi]
MTTQLIKVLLVEDNPGDVQILKIHLRQANAFSQLTLTHVETLKDALGSLAQHSVDVILLDLSLKDSEGLETFIRLHQETPATPIIVLTGLDDEALAIQAMQQGAQDYLPKGEVNGSFLLRSMRYAIERTQADRKIREQAALLEVTTDAICVRGLDSLVSFWNQGAERLYGWKVEEAIGQNADVLLYPDGSPLLETALQTVIETGKWQGELHTLTKDEKKVVVASRWTLMRNEVGYPKSILIVDTDITEQKHLEGQLLRAQRLESIGTLASGIAHDLNNILTPILAASQLLQLKLTDCDDRTQEFLDMLVESAKRGSGVINQMLSFTRGAEGKFITLQVRHVIAELKTMLYASLPKSINIRLDVPQDLWMISGDGTQLHQVLMNLCVNARDAMPDGGTLKITARNQLLADQEAQQHLDAQGGHYTVVTISDTGTGIPPEILDRMFEPFFTTKAIGKGSGLGLSSVAGIVKSHRGFITVSSQVGEGTQFQIFLPAVHVTESLQVEDSELPSGDGELILVVDDEAFIREIVKVTLEDCHYRVLTAQHGVEAIALYAEHKDEIRLVLLDLMMPSLDGASTVYTLRKLNSTAQIVAMSGLSTTEMKVKAASAGVQAFLPKPFTAQELLEIVLKQLDRFRE